ncbi:aldehyde dehydrogenase family protein [Rhodococcus sp. NPDC057529]|uniref:aldehyde dehydrogenase family protein n=1 Tax=Rhodococcus sp. NPDC057529 TaxID=3346158 RepID=UPI00366BFFC6
MTTSLRERLRDALSAPTLNWIDGQPLSLLIDGRSQPGHAEEIVDVIDPGSGLTIASAPAARADDVDAAVGAARTAFDDGRWSEKDADEREAVLHTLVGLMQRHHRTLTELESLDTGKPLDQASEDVDEAIAVLGYFAGWANKAEGTVVPAPRRFFAATVREPIGVCAAITPWNYPLPILMYKLAPALAFGNTTVIKPSELASLSTVYLANLVAEAGVPDGVVNVVIGGGTVGQHLAGHPDVDKIGFTGSTRTGQSIMRSAADSLKKLGLELGGKSAHIVFSDADLTSAADAVLGGIWTNSGQLCVAGSRLLVQDTIHDEFVAELARRTGDLVIGHGMLDQPDIGPVISRDQRDRIESLLATAVFQGAEPITGPPIPQNNGFYVSPTILTDVRRGSTIAQEEVFGPVLSVLPFTDERDAIAVANDTSFGLAAGVWSRDIGRIHRVARRVQAGTVWANTYGIFHHTVPFGGMKSSGLGRELGSAAVEHYTQLKSLVLDISNDHAAAETEPGDK